MAGKAKFGSGLTGKRASQGAPPRAPSKVQTPDVAPPANPDFDLAIGQFIDENEEILKGLIKDKGVQVLKVSDPKDFDALTAKFETAQRAKNIADAKGFGVKDPGAILDAYAAAYKKWHKLSPGIGRNIDKFTDAIWDQIYSKVDPAKL